MKMRAFRRSLKTLGAVLLTAGTLTALKPAVSFAAYSYPSAAKYTAGDAEIKKPVRNLDVDWVSGQITVAYHSADTVELHETSKKQISKDMQMRWWLDGDTLRVRYAKPGFHTLFARNKQLTITLPEDIVFDEVSMTATSADFLIPALQTDTLKLHVISGDIEAAADARNAAVRANSGDLDLHFGGKAVEITAETTSGEIGLEAAAAEHLSAASASGKIELRAERVDELQASSASGSISAEVGRVKRAALSTTSGNADVAFDRFDALSISATSGNVRADLPEEPGFTASLKAGSGHIKSDLPLTKEGKVWTCGSGSSEVSIATGSGNITLR